jgi:DNA (cytosine-5)-methyltransferase 1
MAASQIPRPGVISLFSGAMGLDLGLERSGFDIRVVVERNPHAAETIRKNRPQVPLIAKPVEEVTKSEILEAAGLRQGEATAVVGGPGCQSFSTAGQRASLADPRGVLFRHFVRLVTDTEPRFFVMENVRGILSAAVRHRPLAERGPGHPRLQADEQLGSGFRLMLSELAGTGYHIVFGLANAADYGVPQTRTRLVVIGSRDGEAVCLPTATHSKDGSGGKPRWVSFREALYGFEEEPEYEPLSPSKCELLQLIPAGGNWRVLPAEQRERAIGAAYRSWGGRSGFLRRLSWDEPSPSVTTTPNSKATMMCHPEETRPLSVGECARLQQFPPDWVFEGPLTQRYMQVGNAVPLGLAQAIGDELMRLLQRQPLRRSDLKGVVATADTGLAARLRERPRVVANPPRMRTVKDVAAMKSWVASCEAPDPVDVQLLAQTHCQVGRSPGASIHKATG